MISRFSVDVNLLANRYFQPHILQKVVTEFMSRYGQEKGIAPARESLPRKTIIRIVITMILIIANIVKQEEEWLETSPGCRASIR